MEMPNRIKIGDKLYEVLTHEDTMYDHDNLGQIDYDKSRIIISEKQENK